MTKDEINYAVSKFTAYLRANGVKKHIVFVATDLEDRATVGHFTQMHGFNKSEVIGILSVELSHRTADTLKK